MVAALIQIMKGIVPYHVRLFERSIYSGGQNVSNHFRREAIFSQTLKSMVLLTNFPLFRTFDIGLTIKQGQAPVINYIDKLIDLVSSGLVVLDDVISHELPLTDAAHGL